MGARTSVLTQEVKIISDGLAGIISSVYQPGEKGLQLPEPKYGTDKEGNPYAFFTAHFTTCPVEDLEAAKRMSRDLRYAVMQRLGGIIGFIAYDS